jgi:hypothetical protein
VQSQGVGKEGVRSGVFIFGVGYSEVGAGGACTPCGLIHT